MPTTPNRPEEVAAFRLLPQTRRAFAAHAAAATRWTDVAAYRRVPEGAVPERFYEEIAALIADGRPDDQIVRVVAADLAPAPTQTTAARVHQHLAHLTNIVRLRPFDDSQWMLAAQQDPATAAVTASTTTKIRQLVDAATTGQVNVNTINEVSTLLVDGIEADFLNAVAWPVITITAQDADTFASAPDIVHDVIAHYLHDLARARDDNDPEAAARTEAAIHATLVT